jgi:hypothetical protein
MSNSKLGTISLFVKDRHNLAEPVNKILNAEGRLIMSRMGLNVEPKCISDCLAIITLAVCGSEEELDAFKVKLNELDGVTAVLNLMS